MPALLAISTVTALAFAGTLAPPIALAGPDDGLGITSEGHVDSPKAFWDKKTKNFSLHTEFRGATPRIEENVVWFGKGSGSPQQYIYTVGQTEGEDFLGPEGTKLYWGPAVTSRNYPIWLGFGADIGIPAKNFRDESFSIDLVNFDGPGRMEAFADPRDGTGLNRLWSSHTPGLRSAWVRPGTHTHNQTTLTKPGRYRLTYRVSARDAGGKLVASKPQTVTWQVGGTPPKKDGLGDVAKAYDRAAPQGSAKGSGMLSIAPHKPTENDVPGAKDLHDLTFSTGNNADDGTAVFYVDGYFLSEVPVKNGKAVWPEMLGSQASNIQAVYVPRSHGTRFVTAPVAFKPGAAAAKTSEAGKFPTPHSKDPAPAFATKPFAVTDRKVNVTSTPREGGELTDLTVEPADQRVALRVTGGYYEPGEDNTDCMVEFTSAPGLRTRAIDTSLCGDVSKTELRLRAVPTALPDAGGATAKLAPTGKQSFELAAPKGSDPASEKPTPEQPSPSQPEPGKPEQPSEDPQAGPLVINRGHIDLGPVLEGKKLRFAVGDESGLYAPKKVNRNPSDVVLAAGKEFAHTLRQGDMDKGYGFLGKEGDKIYFLGQTQRENQLWPGFSTEYAGGDAYDIELRPESTPEGGRWYAFTSSAFNGVGERLGSSEGPTKIERDRPIHLHNNWAFTKPGEYKIAMRAMRHGGGDTTDWETVTFRVGEAPQGQPGDPRDADPAPAEPDTDPGESSPASSPATSAPSAAAEPSGAEEAGDPSAQPSTGAGEPGAAKTSTNEAESEAAGSAAAKNSAADDEEAGSDSEAPDLSVGSATSAESNAPEQSVGSGDSADSGSADQQDQQAGEQSQPRAAALATTGLGGMRLVPMILLAAAGMLLFNWRRKASRES